MAKNDNLKDFLTEIADTIRAKKGITGKINPQDFSDEIASITSGPVTRQEAPMNDVVFYDYDGFRLCSYSKEEFLAMTSMPSLPTSPGLICQDWNWAIEDAKEYVGKYGLLDIGALYTTDDGKTRLYLTFTKESRKDVTLRFTIRSIANKGVIVDWGDGSITDAGTEVKDVALPHSYQYLGDYIINIETNGGVIRLGHSSSNYNILYKATADNYPASIALKRVETGNGVEAFSPGSFRWFRDLQSITIPKNVKTIGSFVFNNTGLQFVVLPDGEYTSANALVSYNYGLKGYCPSKGFIPQSSCFQNCFLIIRAVIPEITTINSKAFSGIYEIDELIFPGTISEIKSEGFSSCYGVKTFVFSHHKTTPTLESTNAFPSTPYSIVVPDELFDSWKTSTNWSSLSSTIIKLSEYNAQ